jgi:phosphoribosyl 1,2-cyclic phosphodiesterase
MSVKITILGSGSKGNSIVIENNGASIMIDAGFTAKELIRKMNNNNIDHLKLQALAITHDHSDHVYGARVLADRLQIPTFTTFDTHRYLKMKNQVGKNVIVIEKDEPVEVAGMVITPFSVSHDTPDPVGFVVEVDGKRIGIATDLGCMVNDVERYLTDCTALVLESNYDCEMLANSGRPVDLIRRIRGRLGHLSNLDALAALETLLTPNTKHLVMAHVSMDCNDYDLVEGLTQEKLLSLNRKDIEFQVARQNESIICKIG